MGRLDVDQMLSELTPQEFDAWVIYLTRETLPEEWLRHGMVAAEISNQILAVQAGFGGRKLKDSDLRSPNDFNPWRQKTKKRVSLKSVAEFDRQMRGMIGV